MKARRELTAARLRVGSEDGFTLLEVILAMAMTAILASSLFAVLSTAYRAEETAETALEPLEAASVAVSIVGKDLELALPPKGILAGPFLAYPVEVGTSRPIVELYRVAPLASPLSPVRRLAGIERIAFYLAMLPGEELPVLVRTTTGNLLSPVTQEPEPEVICRRVSALQILYFDGTTWYEAWDSTVQGDVLPLAVQISLEVSRPARGSRAGAAYGLTRTFALPCGEVPVLAEGSS